MTNIVCTQSPLHQPLARVNLMGLSKVQMEQFFLELGEKKFRAQQVLKWIHHAGVTQIEEMTNLGKSLREKLLDVAEVRPPEIVSQKDSTDGTRKWAIRVDDLLGTTHHFNIQRC